MTAVVLAKVIGIIAPLACSLNAAAAAGATLSAKDVLRAVGPSTAFVFAAQGADIRSGSGFVVSSAPASSDVVTAYHVVAGAANVVVAVGGDLAERYPAVIVSADRLRDSVLLRIGRGGLRALRLPAGAAAAAGTPVAVVGYPGMHTLAPAVTSAATGDTHELISQEAVSGKVLLLRENDNRFFFDAPVSRGDSGAPVIDLRSGYVVGMAEGVAYQAYGLDAWLSGNALGLAARGLASVLHPAARRETGVAGPRPTAAIALTYKDPAAAALAPAILQHSLDDWTVQPDFIAQKGGAWDESRAPQPADLCKSLNVNAVLLTSVHASAYDVNTAISAFDCSGAPFFSASQTDALQGRLLEQVAAGLVTRLEQALCGYADAHRPAWLTLLRFRVALDPADASYHSLMDLEEGFYGGLMVGHVFPGGPAYLAGIRAGDFIESIAGRLTRSMSAANAAALLNRPSCAVVVARHGVKLRLLVKPKKSADIIDMLR